ncbi:MAG TPA: trehalose-phosphatase [Candidatus Sulfotelmatobacter sp.]|nr:trehalose-phosphatase [Candidatus Sulfotelmatobacter sp.]
MLQSETQDTSADVQKKIAGFLARVSRASKRALLLDYDGTLAPFTPDRDHAVPYPEIPALLERIRTATATRLVIVTGRRAFEVASLLNMKNIEIWGCHGLSRWRSDGTFELPQFDQQALNQLSEANELLRQANLSDLLELKPGATAIHWRGQEPRATQVQRAVEDIWSRLRGRKHLELLKFDGGLEIRAVYRDKGDAVRTILSELGQGATVAYLGDDYTDEDAFAALQGFGLGILVRQRHRPTIADLWLRPPDGVIGFLADWIRACGVSS